MQEMQVQLGRPGRSPGEGNGNSLTPVFLPEKFHGQRNLMGYNPWGCKESDITEHTRTKEVKFALDCLQEGDEKWGKFMIGYLGVTRVWVKL